MEPGMAPLTSKRFTDEVRAYQKKAASKSDLERTELNKEKTGVLLDGVKGVNPVNGEALPIFISDYVLASYGTGAIMAVPAHDERDFDFAKVFDLPIVQVVAPADSEAAKNASPDPVTLTASTSMAGKCWNSFLEPKQTPSSPMVRYTSSMPLAHKSLMASLGFAVPVMDSASARLHFKA